MLNDPAGVLGPLVSKKNITLLSLVLNVELVEAEKVARQPETIAPQQPSVFVVTVQVWAVG